MHTSIPLSENLYWAEFQHIERGGYCKELVALLQSYINTKINILTIHFFVEAIQLRFNLAAQFMQFAITRYSSNIFRCGGQFICTYAKFLQDSVYRKSVKIFLLLDRINQKHKKINVFF